MGEQQKPEKKIITGYLINEGDKVFEDRCNGKLVKIPPGKAAKVPDYVAYHFIGDPRVINGEDGLAAAAEEKRIYMRYAAFKPEQRAERIPKLRFEPIEEEETQVVDLKKEAVAAREPEPEEPEFPELKVEPQEEKKHRPQPLKKGL